jgi:hypothetical protein
LSVAASDYDLQSQGMRRELLSRQDQLVNQVRASLDRKAMKELGVRWLMFSDEEAENLLPPARAELAKLQPVVAFEGAGPKKTRRIWRVD